METYQFLTIIGSLVGCFGYLLIKMDKHIDDVEKQVRDSSDRTNSRIDHIFKMLTKKKEDKNE
jgi:hypothetical protein